VVNLLLSVLQRRTRRTTAASGDSSLGDERLDHGGIGKDLGTEGFDVEFDRGLNVG
jgi:hypothetical protein